MTSKYKIIAIGQISNHETIYQYGKSYKEVGITILDTTEKSLATGNPIRHDGVMTVYEDKERRQYIDFTRTRFKESLGIVYL